MSELEFNAMFNIEDFEKGVFETFARQQQRSQESALRNIAAQQSIYGPGMGLIGGGLAGLGAGNPLGLGASMNNAQALLNQSARQIMNDSRVRVTEEEVVPRKDANINQMSPREYLQTRVNRWLSGVRVPGVNT